MTTKRQKVKNWFLRNKAGKLVRLHSSLYREMELDVSHATIYAAIKEMEAEGVASKEGGSTKGAIWRIAVRLEDSFLPTPKSVNIADAFGLCDSVGPVMGDPAKDHLRAHEIQAATAWRLYLKGDKKAAIAAHLEVDREKLDDILNDVALAARVANGDKVFLQCIASYSRGLEVRTFLETHTPECIRNWALYGHAQDAYDARWPEHCDACHGTGAFFYSYDPSPPGVSLGPGTMQGSVPCPHCTETGICPRCGVTAWPTDESWPDDGTATCWACHWSEDQAEEMAGPVPPDCTCGVEQIFADSERWDETRP